MSSPREKPVGVLGIGGFKGRGSLGGKGYHGELSFRKKMGVLGGAGWGWGRGARGLHFAGMEGLGRKPLGDRWETGVVTDVAGWVVCASDHELLNLCAREKRKGAC